MSNVDLGWIRLTTTPGHVVIIEMLPKDDFEVDRDQPVFEYMFEEALCQAVKNNTAVGMCVDATQVNYLTMFTAPYMMSRFLSLVQKLHDYPESVGDKVKREGVANDLVSKHLGATAIVIASPLVRTIINGVVSVVPAKRPIGFFNDLEEATRFASEHTLQLMNEH